MSSNKAVLYAAAIAFFVFNSSHLFASPMDDLINAAGQNDSPAAVTSLLDSGAVHLNDKSSTGNSALLAATWLNRVDTTQILLERGADPNIAAANGHTSLWNVVFHSSSGQAQLLALLLAHKATNLGGASASLLHKIEVDDFIFAAGDGDDPTTVTNFLDSGTVQPDDKSSTGNSALLAATWLNRVDTTQILLERGADPNIAAANGHTSLWNFIFRTDDDQILALLLSHGATALGGLHPADLHDAEVGLLITAARSSDNSTMVTRILNEGIVHVDDKTSGGNSALLAATWFNRLDTTQILLARSASPDIAAANGHTSLWNVVFNNSDPRILFLLLDDHASNFGEFSNSDVKNWEIADFIAAAGRDDSPATLLGFLSRGLVHPNDKSLSGDSALLSSTWANHLDTTQILLDNLADPNIAAADKWTPLSNVDLHTHDHQMRALLVKYHATISFVPPSPVPPLPIHTEDIPLNIVRIHATQDYMFGGTEDGHSASWGGFGTVTIRRGETYDWKLSGDRAVLYWGDLVAIPNIPMPSTMICKGWVHGGQAIQL